MWQDDRAEHFASFALPDPVPPRIVGVNSVELSTIAGRRAEGVNVAWDHPKRTELLSAATKAAAGRPFLKTAWIHWSPELLHDDHPTRCEMELAGLDRIILVVIDSVEAFTEQL